MKKLIVLAVVVLCSIPAFAGEYLTNENVAYGLHVTFSEPVAITNFGDVLTVVEPQGEATEFVFSGAELPACVGHWLAWTPASARIESYDWITSPISESISSLPANLSLPGLLMETGFLFRGDGEFRKGAGIYRAYATSDLGFESDGVAWGMWYQTSEREWRNHISQMVPYLASGKVFSIYEAAENFHQAEPQLEEIVCAVDVYGQPIEWKPKDTWQAANVYRHNVFHPAMREYLKSRVAAMIDAGATSVMFDDYGAIRLISAGGTFDPWTEGEFRKYLTEQFSDSELKSLFDIANPEQFSMSAWLRRKSLASTWNEPPFNDLEWEFILFMFRLEADTMQEIAEFAKHYAMESQSRDFLIGVNSDTAHGVVGRLAGSCDYFVREIFTPLDTPPANMKLLRAIAPDYARVFLMEVYDDPQYGSFPAKTVSDLLLWTLAAAAASGSSAIIPPSGDLFRAVPGWIYTDPLTYDMGVARRMSAFIGNNRGLFDASEGCAPVGVLYDESSSLDSVRLKDIGWWTWNSAIVRGTANILTRANIQFDFVDIPDQRFVPQRVGKSELEGYDIIVVPNAVSLPLYVQDLLLQFADQGGIVVVTGETARHTPGCVPSSSPLLQSMHGQKSDYGSGSIVFIQDDPGWAYMTRNAQWPVSQLVRAIEENLSSRIICTGPKVALTARQHDHSYVIHMVNDNYIKGRDRLVPTGNFEIRIQDAALPAGQAFLISPDYDDVVRVQRSSQGGYDVFRIPSITSIGSLIIADEGEHQAMSITAPPAPADLKLIGDVIAIGPLVPPTQESICTWYVNSQPVAVQSFLDSFELHFRLDDEASLPLLIECYNWLTGSSLGSWEVDEKPDIDYVLYDFEPIFAFDARGEEIKLYGRAKELAESGLAGVEFFGDRGAIVEASTTEDGAWEGRSLRISYTPMLDNDFQKLFTGVMLTDFTSPGLSDAQYLKFAYRISNPLMEIYLVFFDRDGEAFQYECDSMERDGAWHKKRIPLSSFRFGGFGSPPDKNKTLDLDEGLSLHVYLVLLHAKNTTEYFFMDNIGLSN